MANFCQYIINYFSFIQSCKIIECFIPISIIIIRTIFIFFFSLLFNIFFLNQTYYAKKFNYFNEKYKLIHSENSDLYIPNKERILYVLRNTFANSIIKIIIINNKIS